MRLNDKEAMASFAATAAFKRTSQRWLALLQRSDSRLFMRLSSGVFWVFVGNLVWKLCTALSTIYIARILGRTGFGQLGMVLSTSRLFSVFASLRLGTMATKYVAQYRMVQPAKALRILDLTLYLAFVTCAVFALACVIVAPFLAQYSLQTPDLTLPLMIGGGLVFFLIYGNVLQHALAGFEAFRYIAYANIARGVLTCALCLPLAIWAGLIGVVWGYVLVAALCLGLVGWCLNRQRATLTVAIEVADVPAAPDADSECQVLWQYAAPGVLSGVVVAATMWYGRFLLTDGPDGFAQLGVFNAADQWRASVLFFPSVLTRVFLPILSESFGQHSQTDFVRKGTLSLQTVCMTAFPVAALVMALSESLVGMFGSDFQAAADVLPILMLSVFFHCLNQSVRQIYDSSGKRWVNLGMYVIWSLCYLSGSIYLVQLMGILGFAIAIVFADICLFTIQILYVEIAIAKSIFWNVKKIFLLSLISMIIILTCKMIFRAEISFLISILCIMLTVIYFINCFFPVSLYKKIL